MHLVDVLPFYVMHAGFPQITSQINYLHYYPCLKVCFWENINYSPTNSELSLSIKRFPNPLLPLLCCSCIFYSSGLLSNWFLSGELRDAQVNRIEGTGDAETDGYCSIRAGKKNQAFIECLLWPRHWTVKCFTKVISSHSLTSPGRTKIYESFATTCVNRSIKAELFGWTSHPPLL